MLKPLNLGRLQRLRTGCWKKCKWRGLVPHLRWRPLDFMSAVPPPPPPPPLPPHPPPPPDFQLQALDRSVPRRTRTASSGSECSRQTSTASARSQCSQAPDQVCPAGPQPQKISEDITDRMPARRCARKNVRIYARRYVRIIGCLKVCQNRCQEECQSIGQKEWLPHGTCQTLCQNNGSGWGSLEENIFIVFFPGADTLSVFAILCPP